MHQSQTSQPSLRCTPMIDLLYRPRAPGVTTLALVYHAQGRYEEAEALYQEASAVVDQTVGMNYSDIAQGLENYAALLRQLDRTDETEQIGVALCPASLRRFVPPGVIYVPLKDPSSLFYVECGISCRSEDDSALTAGFIEIARKVGRPSMQSRKSSLGS